MIGPEPPYQLIRLYMTSLYVKVDPALYPALSLIRWRRRHMGSGGKWYAAGSVGGVTVLMHRYIMGCTDPAIFIDHRTGDTLDNRKAWNLRESDALKNVWNRPGEDDRGLTWVARRLQYRVHITARGRRHDIGWFDTRESAREARRQAEITHYGFEMRPTVTTHHHAVTTHPNGVTSRKQMHPLTETESHGW